MSDEKKNFIKKLIAAIILIAATRIPSIVGNAYWLPKATTPMYFFAIRYTLECVIWILVALYLVWWITDSKKK